MGKRIEDLKETAPCGMLIHYTVNEEDMITYNDINGRGVHCDKCDGCTWKGICKPEEPKKAIEVEELCSSDPFRTRSEREQGTSQKA